jgi:2-hydroxychromene-2-carboxylate isomerase
MGTVISLHEHRRARTSRMADARGAPARATLFFDLGSPYTYLAAERADRLFERLEWLPASADALQAAALTEEGVRSVRDRALLLRLPFVWPEEPPQAVRGAMRVASLAAQRGCGAAFVLAASRLAFCGGFDIDDPEILAEAAAAAGIGLGETLAAAGDAGRDGPIEDAGRLLLAAGAARLPALRVGRMLFCGEGRLLEAAAAARAAV